MKFNPKELVSQATAAKMRGVSRQAIAELVQRGRLKTVVIDGTPYLLKKEVENFQPDTPGPKTLKTATRRRKSN